MKLISLLAGIILGTILGYYGMPKLVANYTYNESSVRSQLAEMNFGCDSIYCASKHYFKPDIWTVTFPYTFCAPVHYTVSHNGITKDTLTQSNTH